MNIKHLCSLAVSIGLLCLPTACRQQAANSAKTVGTTGSSSMLKHTRLDQSCGDVTVDLGDAETEAVLIDIPRASPNATWDRGHPQNSQCLGLNIIPLAARVAAKRFIAVPDYNGDDGGNFCVVSARCEGRDVHITMGFNIDL